MTQPSGSKAAGSGKNGLECSDEPFTHSSIFLSRCSHNLV